jgi:hypothetical protein
MRKMKRKPMNKLQCLQCKEVIISTRIYCDRLGEYVEDVVYCPYFEQKPEVKLRAVI